MNLDNPVHVSLNKPSVISCVASQSRPPVRMLIAINGKLITDESKYTTEVVQTPILNTQEGDSIPPIKLPQSANIPIEDMRKSFYETITNLTINDVTMAMQGQLVECFAYSFITKYNPLKAHKGKHHSNPIADLSQFQKDVMNTKSVIQVNCEFQTWSIIK